MTVRGIEVLQIEKNQPAFEWGIESSNVLRPKYSDTQATFVRMSFRIISQQLRGIEDLFIIIGGFLIPETGKVAGFASALLTHGWQHIPL